MTFTAEVANGRLCFSESLQAFEGSTVLVSIEPASRKCDGPGVADAAEPDVEPDIDVEVDVYAPFVWKRREVVGNAVINDLGRMRPSGVMPEVEEDV